MLTFKRILLMNSAMMPQAGYYAMVQATPAQIARVLLLLRGEATIESYIGYQQNADILSRIIDRPVPLSRAETRFSDDALAVVMRLRYRLNNPATKGQSVPDNSFEFFLVCYGSNPAALANAEKALAELLAG